MKRITNKPHARECAINDKITTHLGNPKYKVLIEYFASINGVTISEFVADYLINDLIPQFSKVIENKDNAI